MLPLGQLLSTSHLVYGVSQSPPHLVNTHRDCLHRGLPSATSSPFSLQCSLLCPFELRIEGLEGSFSARDWLPGYVGGLCQGMGLPQRREKQRDSRWFSPNRLGSGNSGGFHRPEVRVPQGLAVCMLGRGGLSPAAPALTPVPIVASLFSRA